MKNRLTKILTAAGIALMPFLTCAPFVSCGDDGIMNIYNKYTESYRETNDDLLNHNDSCITVRVLSSHTNLPLNSINVVLTMPAYDTLTSQSDENGFAVFRPGIVSKGTYSVKATLYANGNEYCRRNTYYINEKNNSTLIIYINERTAY